MPMRPCISMHNRANTPHHWRQWLCGGPLLDILLRWRSRARTGGVQVRLDTPTEGPPTQALHW
eukprot:7360491-Prorocentrum_lima.AAC.1